MKKIKYWVSILLIACLGIIVLPIQASAATNGEIRSKMIAVLYGNAGGRMTCDFDGYVTTSGRHEGIDFMASKGAGSSIYSLISGVVTRVTNSDKLSTLAIYDSKNNKTVVYLHGIYSVSQGQNITQGQYLGKESNKGASAAHSHIEVRDGKRTAAAVSVGDSVLDNSDPYPYWNTIFAGGSTSSGNHTVNNTYSGFVPFKAYANNTGKINVYTANGTQYSNRYISGSSDLCTIEEVYTDGWCKVTYPSSAEASGYFTAYTNLSEFLPGASPSVATATSGGTAYRRSSGSETIGSISSGDRCLKVSGANGRIAAIYPVTGQNYSKAGWVAESVFGGGNSGSVPSAAGYKVPCKAYTIGTGRITVYNASHQALSNRYIDGAADLCTINSVGTDGWCQVTYPTSSGSNTAYVPLSTFIPGSASVKSWNANKNFTAYRRSSGGDTIGSISAGDACVKVASENGRTQIMYPVSGQNYYKMGWIDGDAGSNPAGTYDSATGGIYSVIVRGWAFDEDDINATLGIHVYIGDTCVGTGIADRERKDVNAVYGCGNHHGFDIELNLDKKFAGEQTVKVYAINVGGGDNAFLGEKKVTIGSDTQKPVLTECKITNLTSSGYTVSCKATDNTGIDRVQFPTWTQSNGQDDLFENWSQNPAASGQKNGDIYTYEVKSSAHNYESGLYYTHIYAYDKYGNQTVAELSAVVPVDVEDIVLNKEQIEFDSVGEEEKLEATIYPENATDKSVKWSSDNTAVATVKDGVVTATGEGETKITATTEGGKKAECIVKVKEQPAGILTVENVSGKQGETVSVAIKLEQNPGIIAARLKIDYDAQALTLAKVEDGGILGEHTFGNDLKANPYTVLWENGTVSENITATGTLAVMTFKINEEASEGLHEIKVSYDPEEVYNVKLRNVKFTVNNGAVTVSKADTIVQQGTCGTNVTWTLDKEGKLTVTGTGDMKNYDYVKAVPWYQYADQIKSIVVENGVTSVGAYAFYGLKNMTAITLPNGVKTIGGYAFKNCTALTDIKLPSTLTKLGESAFYGCSKMPQIQIPEGVYTVWAYTFKNCTSLQEVILPQTLIKLDEAAFYGCSSLKQINIPKEVSIIGIYCFKNCSSLSSIQLPESMTAVREAAFYGTAISEITIPDKVKTIGRYAFKNCVNLQKIQLPKNLEKIEESAFYANTGLTQIDLPDIVKTIGNYAFRRCSGLQSVQFSEQLQTIGESAFYGCGSIEEIVLPDNVININGYAFKGCTSLKNVTLSKNLEVLGESAFYGCTGITTIEIPEKVKTMGDYLFSSCSGLKKVVFTGNAPEIAGHAFARVTAEVVYPSENETWTQEKLQNYGGTLTWKPSVEIIEEEPEATEDASEVTESSQGKDGEEKETEEIVEETPEETPSEDPEEEEKKDEQENEITEGSDATNQEETSEESKETEEAAETENVENIE